MSKASLNGLSSGDIAGKTQTDSYRFLLCADKFHTGYDEPLPHIIYVDKPLVGHNPMLTEMCDACLSSIGPSASQGGRACVATSVACSAKYGYPPDLAEGTTQLVLRQPALSTGNAE